MQLNQMFSVSSEWLLNNLMALLVAVIVLVVGWALSRTLSRAVSRMLPNTRAFDDTITPLISQLVRYSVLLITLIIVLSQFGVQTTSILAVLGAAGLAIALALQGTLANIASGVMLIWLRPIAVGEYIDGEGLAGTVVEIGLFGVRLLTADGVYVFAPNSKLWAAAITNYSRESRRRLDINVGIAYDADIAKAREVLMDMARGEERVLPDPEPVVYVSELASSSVNLILRCWVATSDYWPVRFQFIENAKLGLDKANVEIPFNKVDVHIVSSAQSAAPAPTQHVEQAAPPADDD